MRDGIGSLKTTVRSRIAQCAHGRCVSDCDEPSFSLPIALCMRPSWIIIRGSHLVTPFERNKPTPKRQSPIHLQPFILPTLSDAPPHTHFPFPTPFKLTSSTSRPTPTHNIARTASQFPSVTTVSFGHNALSRLSIPHFTRISATSSTGASLERYFPRNSAALGEVEIVEAIWSLSVEVVVEGGRRRTAGWSWC